MPRMSYLYAIPFEDYLASSLNSLGEQAREQGYLLYSMLTMSRQVIFTCCVPFEEVVSVNFYEQRAIEWVLHDKVTYMHT